MKPRDFLNFFRSRSGKLLLFAIIFGGGLLLFSVLRERSGSSDDDVRVTHLASNTTDRPQVVQSIERPMQAFRPPPVKTNAPPPPLLPKTNEPPRAVVEAPKPEPPRQLPALTLVPDAGVGTPEPRTMGSTFAPFGRLIPCETVITVDSASIKTPIVGLITENIFHAGKLVIPAGTEVHGTAQTDRQRERIASGETWTLVWQGGEELRLKALALDREFSRDQEGWGITDGSAGLRGRIIKSDNMAEIKLFATTFLSGAADALTEKEQTIFGAVNSRSLNNAPFEGAQKVLSTYAQRILEAIQRDGFYVRVPSGKQFYLYVLQTIDRSDAAIGGTLTPFEDETNAFPPNIIGAAHAPFPPTVRAISAPAFSP